MPENSQLIDELNTIIEGEELDDIEGTINNEDALDTAEIADEQDSVVKERLLDRFLHMSVNIGKMTFQAVDLIFMLAMMILGLIVRIKLYPIESADYWGFLELWMEKIKELGGFPSLGTKIGNYTTPYMVLMCLVSGIENSHYALKSISVFFDYSAAFAAFGIIYEITHSERKAILGFSLLLLCPTVFIDSAYWCQCDVIYTSFILWSLYFFFKDKSRASMIFLGIAFAFKLQTVLILPFYLIMWLKKRTVKILELVYLPIIYVIAQLPAWLFGRDFVDLMTIYLDQSGYYPWGTLEYPNIYALLDETIESNHHMDEISSAGTFVCIALLGFLAYYIYVRCGEITNELAVSIALFSVACAVYTLPHMHDRYGFLIDLIAIVYAVVRPKKLPVMCGFVLVSILTFMPYLIAVHIFDIRTVAVFQLALIIYVGYDLYKEIASSKKEVTAAYGTSDDKGNA